MFNSCFSWKVPRAGKLSSHFHMIAPSWRKSGSSCPLDGPCACQFITIPPGGASPFCYLPGPRGNQSLWLQIRATNVQAFIYVFLNNTSTHELSIISQDRRIEGWHDLLRYQRANSCPSGIWIPAPLAPRPMCAALRCPAFQWAYDPRRRQPSRR